MHCERIQDLYDDYTCAALAPEQMSAVEDHLAECADCRACYEELTNLGAMLRQEHQVDHPGNDYFDRLANKVMVRVEAPRDAADADPALIIDATPSAWLRPARWAGGLAAAALLGAALLPLVSGPGDAQLASAPSEVHAPSLAAAPSFNPADSGVGPTVVAMEQQTRRVLNIENTLLDGVLSMPPAADSAPQLVNKGITGIGTNPNSVEQMMHAAPATAGARPRAAEDYGRSDYKQQLVARRPNDADQLSKDTTERIRQVREQMALGTNGEELRASLGELQRTVGDNAQLQSLAFVKQTRLYLAASDALEAGRVMDAAKFYIQLRMNDESSPLASRAALHLADIYFGEYADFSKAGEYYALVTRPGAPKALTANEQEHARKRQERIARYAPVRWEPLLRLHALRKGESMEEVRTSLRSLTGSPAAEDLMPEASAIVVERLRLNPATNANLTLEFYKLIEAQAASAAKPELRAALELALGNLAMDQFKDLPLALTHYRRSVEIAADSEAAGAAREKLRTLDDQFVVNLMR